MMTTSLALPPEGVGECIMTSQWDPAAGSYSLIIKQADPVILISAYLLRQIFEDNHTDCVCCYAHVRLADMIPVDDIYLGATLRIEGVNQTVVYQISERRDEHSYIGRWPD